MEQSYQFPHSSPEQMGPPQGGEPGVKLSKAEVNYRAAGSSETSCGNCAHYLGDGVCEVVSGIVSTGGVSDAWEPRRQSTVDLVGG